VSNNSNFFVTAAQLAPPWLTKGYDGSPGQGGRYQFLQGLAIDALIEKTNQGALASSPGLTLTPTSLPLIGADRQLLQGPTETQASYVARLLAWRQTWALAGNAWSIMKAVAAYLSPAFPDMFCVSDSWVWDYYSVDYGPQSIAYPPFHYNAILSNNWNWDSATNYDAIRVSGGPWWRFWLIINSEDPSAWVAQWPALGTAGQPTLGNAPNASLGFANKSSAFFSTLLNRVFQFVPASAWLRWLLVNFDRSKLIPDALGPGGGIMPDGTWGTGFVITNGVYECPWPSWLAPVPGQPATVGGGSANSKGSAFGFVIQQGQYAPAQAGTVPIGAGFNGSANNITHPGGFVFSIVNGIYSGA
jgi:hypothetical protein